MCIGLEKLKAQSVCIVWIMAMIVFSFLFWFTITPLVFPYSGVKGKKLSRNYIPEFGLIGFLFWIIFLTICWCCFRNLTHEKDDLGESNRLIPNPEEGRIGEGLNRSIKKRLGLLTPDDSVKMVKNEEKEEISKGEEIRLHEVKVEARNISQEGDKSRKRELISRLSNMRRNTTESDEPEMKIISLPDFSTENSLKLLMANECEHCFAIERRTIPFVENENVCEKCRKVHHTTKSESQLLWNSRKRKDLSIDLGENVSTEWFPMENFSEETTGPEEASAVIFETEYSHIKQEGYAILDEIKSEEDNSERRERKSLEKSEGLFLLQALHEQKKSKSEIFLVVNEFGHLMDEPPELAQLHGFKH